MSLLDILNPIQPIIDTVGKIIDKVVPDRAAADAAKAQLLSQESTQEFQLLLGQIQANIEEAKSTNWFVAGARPFILWGCGFAMIYVAILDPIGRFIAMVMFHYAGPFPVIDTTITMQALLGLLGLSGMRTYEKRTGTEGNR